MHEQDNEDEEPLAHPLDAPPQPTTQEPYVCWRCGETLPFALFPLARLERCPACRADLHACRLCRHYDRTRPNQCRHERADPPDDRTAANYCTYFRPQRCAYHSSHEAAARAAQDELAALFGAPEGEVPSSSPSSAGADDALDALEALFEDQSPPKDPKR